MSNRGTGVVDRMLILCQTLYIAFLLLPLPKQQALDIRTKSLITSELISPANSLSASSHKLLEHGMSWLQSPYVHVPQWHSGV